MEFDENDGTEEREDDYVEIYSRKAIFWFSVVSPLIGTIMLIMNLWTAGYKRAIYNVVLFLIAFAIISNAISQKFVPATKINLNVLNKPLLFLGLISLVLNIICAFILSRYFFKKYFPDNDYYPKSIAAPILITILLTFVFRLLMGVGI